MGSAFAGEVVIFEPLENLVKVRLSDGISRNSALPSSQMPDDDDCNKIEGLRDAVMCEGEI